MPETFKFGLAAPGAEESQVHTVRCYQSANGSTGWAVVDEVAIATLVPINGIYTWPTAADEAQYHMLVSVSAPPESKERPAANILPPRPTDPGICTVFLTVMQQNGQPAADVEIASQPKTVPTVVNGIAISPTPIKVKTNATGLATLPLLKGAAYLITAGPVGTKQPIDTTGKDVVDVALQL